jgi:hypothetical protein
MKGIESKVQTKKIGGQDKANMQLVTIESMTRAAVH